MPKDTPAKRKASAAKAKKAKAKNKPKNDVALGFFGRHGFWFVVR